MSLKSRDTRPELDLTIDCSWNAKSCKSCREMSCRRLSSPSYSNFHASGPGISRVLIGRSLSCSSDWIRSAGGLVIHHPAITPRGGLARQKRSDHWPETPDRSDWVDGGLSALHHGVTATWRRVILVASPTCRLAKTDRPMIWTRRPFRRRRAHGPDPRIHKSIDRQSKRL